MDKYPEIAVKRKTGSEQFHENGKSLDDNLLSFWQWSASDLVGNAMRGILAEYIVATAVNRADNNRTEWDSYDIETSEGIKVEVKSCAYIQSWSQKKLSSIQFGIRPTQGWDSKNNSYTNKVERQSDVYVFCVLNHKEQNTIDPLNLKQWFFYVLPTEVLNKSVGDQKTITLSSLIQLSPIEAEYVEVYASIQKAANKAN